MSSLSTLTHQERGFVMDLLEEKKLREIGFVDEKGDIVKGLCMECGTLLDNYPLVCFNETCDKKKLLTVEVRLPNKDEYKLLLLEKEKYGVCLGVSLRGGGNG